MLPLGLGYERCLVSLQRHSVGGCKVGVCMSACECLKVCIIVLVIAHAVVRAACGDVTTTCVAHNLQCT